MKTFRLCSILVALILTPARAGEPELLPLPSGDEILASVRAALPRVPVAVDAELRVRSPAGETERFLLARMRLDWGAAVPTSRYELLDRFGDPLTAMTVTRPPGEPPRFVLDGTPSKPDLFAPVADTELTWMDLTFGYLWWEGAERTGFDEKKGRLCYVVELPAPAGQSAIGKIRLWIDRDVYAVLEAEVYDISDKLKKRIRIKSFQKINDLWTLKDMDGVAYPSRRKTTLRVQKMSVETPETP